MKRKPAEKSVRRPPVVIPEAPAARSATLAVGDVSVRLVWESGTITVGDSTQRILIYDGLYSDLYALNVALGSVIAGYEDWRVSAVTLAPKKGGLGRLTVTLQTASAFSGTIYGTALRVRWEVDMAQIEKPILTHPKLTDDMRTNLQLWMSEEDRKLKMWGKYKDESGTEKSLGSDEMIWAGKIRNGVESYIVFAPVITKVSTCDGRPQTSRPGYIETPATTVDGFEYLKTADRSAQGDDGKWTRTEQWTGADSWDTDLYTA